MFSTPNAFRRQVHMGVLWLLNEIAKEHTDAKIKILIPTDAQITKTIKAGQSRNLHRLILEFMNTALLLESQL